MAYFKELIDYRTYLGHEEDLHFIYNANTGGGQSFLGGKFRDENGGLLSPVSLSGKIGVFSFHVGNDTIVMDDDSVCYEIKPRATGETNMKFSVGSKPTPSSAIAAFLMLPETCGVKHSENIDTSVLCRNNFWLQSMWLEVSGSNDSSVFFIPRDCVFCGGVDKTGNGKARFFSIDITQRISDIIRLAKVPNLGNADIAICINYFADVYTGKKGFNYLDAAKKIRSLMKSLSDEIPERYSGTIDPLPILADIYSLSRYNTTTNNQPRQLITYGAPGTGKSHQTCDEVAGHTVFRTTFHPDSDYSTFVGAYKPTMKDDGVSLTEVTLTDVAGQPAGKEVHDQRKGIAYDFVAQVFTKAYVEAWKNQAKATENTPPAPVFLVIEEINRGNCAQIFGDIFQLLDRNDQGFSEYPIVPDIDLGRFVGAELAKDETMDIAQKARINAPYPQTTDVVDKVLKGQILLLPDNLYIRATMNTSDQSLFPMDSAFKRRWEWKYVPIREGVDKDTQQPLGWKIKFDDCEVDWWQFLKAINKIVKGVTNSSDKQMGYFFVKAKGTEIDAEMFVNKVAFYLWNDVFKDCELDGDAFKITREDGDGVLAFEDFFLPDGTTNKDVLKNFLEKLLPPKASTEESSQG